MVWYGMVWYGMVWYDMVWYGMVRSVQHGTIPYCDKRLELVGLMSSSRLGGRRLSILLPHMPPLAHKRLECQTTGRDFLAVEVVFRCPGREGPGGQVN